MSKPIEEPIILSYTKMDTYLNCPKKYEYQYVDKAPRKEAIHFILGNAIHAALEFNDNNYIKNKEHLQNEEIINVFRNYMRRRIGELLELKHVPKNEVISITDGANFIKEIINGNVEDILKLEKTLADALKLGERMLQSYMVHLRQRKNYQPAVMEQAFNVKLDSAPVQFRGFIDQITKDGYIVDRKTSKAEYKVLMGEDKKPIINPNTGNMIFDGDPQKKLQLIMYALWYRQEHKKKEKGLQYDVITKHSPPRVQLLDIIITEGEVLEAIEQMKDVTQKIRNKDFPTKPSPDNCRFCDHKFKCPSQKNPWHSGPFTFD